MNPQTKGWENKGVERQQKLFLGKLNLTDTLRLKMQLAGCVLSCRNRPRQLHVAPLMNQQTIRLIVIRLRAAMLLG
jgi:hypothetical protein